MTNGENSIGIVGYGFYVPKLRIRVEDIAKVWGQDAEAIKKGLQVEEKAVADSDEDTITISVEAARNAMLMAGIEAKDVGALYIGSESHPYAVKPSGTVVGDALGIGPDFSTVDTEFACRAGSTNIYLCMGLVKAGLIRYGIAIGADTAQGRPGDVLEYTAASGGAAFVIGNSALAVIESHHSYVTDMPDFWRREGQQYPKHGGRFTGEPAYFHHIISATKALMKKTGLGKDDFDYVVFHMPNGKFPRAVCKQLGFEQEKLEKSLVVDRIGNTYSGSSLLGLCNVLDTARPGERILLASFGSGAGSDVFSLKVTERVLERRGKIQSLEQHISRKEYIDYGTYAKIRGKLKA